MANTVYPLTLPENLDREIRQTADKAGISMADTMRMAMKIGLPKVAEGIGRADGRMTNIKSLTQRQIDRIYASDPEWEKIELAAARASQWWVSG